MLKRSFPFILLIILLISGAAYSGKGTTMVFAAAPEGERQFIEPHAPPLQEEDDEGPDIILMIEIAIGLLFIASLVGILTERSRVPYTVGLVLIGLVLSIRAPLEISVSPELFLGLLVPPLIFEAAFHVKAKDLIKDIIPILSLAIPGVLLTTFLVGGVLSWGTNFTLSSALVFGSLIAATDPVAVVALFRTLGVPKRLLLLVEGESLFNDGTAIVIFNLMVTIAITGSFSISDSVFNFFTTAGGGLIVGLLLGSIVSRAISMINNSLIETTLTSVLAFGSYIIAEQFHVSGVLSVVAAGIVSGNLGPSRMSPTTRVLVFSFWEYAAFLANSFVFLLIGIQTDLSILLSNWYAILWAILAVLVARAVSVYGLSWLGMKIPKNYKHVIYWGGLRGAISLALALSLPAALGPVREEIQAMAFGVVLFTLLVQGLTMKPLIRRLGLTMRDEGQAEYERRHARAVMARTAYDRLNEMYKDGLLSRHVWEAMAEPLKQHAEALADAVSRSMLNNPELETRIFESALQEILTAQRGALQDQMREGKISEEVYSQLVNEVDIALMENQSPFVKLLERPDKQKITKMMAIIIQETDFEDVTALLNRSGFSATRLASTGGFLGRRNATLLIGIPEGKDEDIKKLLSQTSIKTIEQDDQTSPKGEQIRHHGTTTFTFNVERFEEI
jgi:CPA1 family monovalent cation:H+ antiporter